MTYINDIVLIYIEENPFTFARIEDINPDHKKGWFHVELLFLQIPMQTVTWLIRDSYLDGAEFQLNGKKVRFEKIENKKIIQSPDDSENDKNSSEEATIIPFSSLKKNEP